MGGVRAFALIMPIRVDDPGSRDWYYGRDKIAEAA
jgi:hypothetical protein